MSGQRARSAVATDHRSALPRVPGIPWWGAILLAATATAVGFAFDAGSADKELSAVFATCYIAGCVVAVLAVRHSGVFTAVIQPALILFVAVPASYFLFHSGEISGIKDILINCGYPLIERFPLMFFTSAVVLTIGLGRWYLGKSPRRAAPKDADAEPRKRGSSKLATDETTTLEAVDAAPKRRRRDHSIERPSRTTASAAADDAPRRPRRTTKAAPAATSRSRHTRPPEVDFEEPAQARPRRRPPPESAEPPVEPRRRPRPTTPREPRHNLPPVEPRGVHERPERRERPSRSDRYERTERPERRRPNGYDPYDPFAPQDPFEGRSPNGSSGSHHPVSRVRYRGDDEGESRTEYRSRPRRPRPTDSDGWDFDA